MTMRRRVIIACALAAVVCAASHAGADEVLLDRVIAIIDDDAILQSDLDQAVKQTLFQRGMTSVPPDQRAEIEKQALEELIGNRLVLAKAKKLGIQASFTEVEDMVEKAIDDNKRALGGQAAFERQLQSEGMTLNELKRLYREQIRNRMLVERVLATDIDRGSFQIGEPELRAAYDERKADLPMRPPVVHLATIYFAFDSSENARANAKAKIDDIYQRIVSGEDFADVARAESEDASAKTGGELGKMNLDDISDHDFAEAAANLEIGDVSDPVLTSHGYHVIQLTGRDTDTQEVELRHILIKIEAGDSDVDEIFAKANSVRDKLDQGASFAEMAKEYSDDAGTADSGGDLGWLRLNDLPEFFQDVLGDMKVSDISQVLREPSGFRIVKLLGTEEPRPYKYEEVREELSEMLQQEKMGSTYENYVAGLHDEFYVDNRYQ